MDVTLVPHQVANEANVACQPIGQAEWIRPRLVKLGLCVRVDDRLAHLVGPRPPGRRDLAMRD